MEAAIASTIGHRGERGDQGRGRGEGGSFMLTTGHRWEEGETKEEERSNRYFMVTIGHGHCFIHMGER